MDGSSTTNDVVEKVGRGRVRPPVFVIGLLVVALVAFLIGDAIFSSDGASSPEGAVQRLADAVTSEDMVGALSSMAPDEVRAIAGTYTAAADKAKALGITGNGTFSWVDLNVDDLQLNTEQLGPDVARVSVVGGKLTAQVHTDRLGAKAKQLGGSDLAKANDAKPSTVEASDLKWRPSRSDGPKRDPFVVAVKRDGGWYVSPFYTAAEYLMASARPDVPRPDYSTIKSGPAAPTPSAAVHQLVSAINDRNVANGIDSLSAGEWAVLRTYRGAIERGIGDAVKDASDDDFHIDDVQLADHKIDDTHTMVNIASFKAHLQGSDNIIRTLDDPSSSGRDLAALGGETSSSSSDFSSGSGTSSIDPNALDPSINTAPNSDQTDASSSDQSDSAPKVRVDIAFDGKCLTVTSPDDHYDSCDQQDSSSFDSGFGGIDATFGIASRIGKQLSESVGIVTVAERGGWSVSPLDTVFGALTKIVNGLTADDLVAITGTEAKQAPQTTMAIGDSKSVQLNESGFSVVGLHLHKGDRFTADVEPEGTKPGALHSAFATLHDSSGEQVGGDAGEPFLFADADGDYKLVVHAAPSAKVKVTLSPVEVKPLALGQTVTGHMASDSATDLYSVPVKKGDVVNPTVSSPASAELLDPNGMSSDLIAPEDGEQIVAVTWEADGENDFAPFDYQLTVSSARPVPIARGGPMQLSIAPGQTQAYIVDGQVGDSIDIDSPDGSAYLSAYDATGTEVDGSPLTEAGPVTIVVEGDSGGADPIPFSLIVGQVTGFLDGTRYVPLSPVDDIADDNYYDTLTLPPGVGGAVVVTPTSGVDVTLGVACLPASDYEENDSVPHVNRAPAGAPELLAVPAEPTAQVCDIEVGLSPASAAKVEESTPPVLLEFRQG